MKYVLTALASLVVLGAILIGGAWALGTSVRPAPAQVPGYITLTIAAPLRSEPLPLHVWYPATGAEAPVLIGQNALFYGHYVRPDAVPVAGPHPLVVLIHGSGGNAERFGWLAADLANRGYIVAAADHPGVRSMDSRQDATLRIWERAEDVTAILDAMLAAPPAGLEIDPAALAAVGFSIGGQTALLAGGLRYDAAAFAAYCGRTSDWDCGWYAQAGIDFATIDAAAYGASRRDPRLAAVVAIDPAGSSAAVAGSGADVRAELLLLNLGDAGALFEGVDATAIAAATGGEHLLVPQSWHFSFLAECSRLGDLVMTVSGEEPICSNRGLRDRAVIHAEARAAIGGFLDRVFARP